MSRRREVFSIEFVAADNQSGRVLVESIRRKGVHIERPYPDGDDIDLNLRYIAARIPRRMVDGLLAKLNYSDPGLESIVGIISPGESRLW